MSQTLDHSDSEAATRPAVSIVLVNYNSAADTNECLASIDDVPFDDYEILVVDNDSDEDPVEAIHSNPDVELLRSAENVGFAQGCNIGARRASGEYLFFLNNDATVTEGLLPRLAAYIEENNGVAAAVPHVLFEHDRKKIDKGLSAFDNLGFGWHPNHLLNVEAESVPTEPCETPGDRDVRYWSIVASLRRSVGSTTTSSCTTRISSFVSGCGNTATRYI